MSSLSHLHLSPFGHDSRAWSLSSSGLFIIKSFFLVLSNYIDPTPSFPIDFVWKSQAPFKVKSFAWLVTLKKVNANGKALWQFVYLSLMWVVWWERNARIF